MAAAGFLAATALVVISSTRCCWVTESRSSKQDRGSLHVDDCCHVSVLWQEASMAVCSRISKARCVWTRTRAFGSSTVASMYYGLDMALS